MGRAVVRNPAVFLFDEPLSNLDAKLRVQMRSEIAALHQKVHTTSIYVTHDQIEAMTLADRIVVAEPGEDRAAGHADRALPPAGQSLRRRLHRFAGDESSSIGVEDGEVMAAPAHCRPAGISDADCAQARKRKAPSQAVTIGPRPEHLTPGSRYGESP